MALQKNKTVLSGFTGDYWRICQIKMNYDRTEAVMTIALYKDQTAREAGALPIDQFQHDFGSSYHDETYSGGEDVMKNASLKEAYHVLKTKAQEEAQKDEEEQNEDLVFFADAVDA